MFIKRMVPSDGGRAGSRWDHDERIYLREAGGRCGSRNVMDEMSVDTTRFTKLALE